MELEKTVLYIAILIIAAVFDYASCAWHRARESKRIFAQTMISMSLELLHWIPIWFAITEEDWKIAGVSILGSGLGTWLGASTREDSDPVVESPQVVTKSIGSTPSLEYSLRQEGPGTVSVLIETSELRVKKP